MRGPKAYEVGAKLHAKDKGGYWYPAKIIEREDRRPTGEVSREVLRLPEEP